MKSYASKLVRKDLSRSIYKNGIPLTEYFENIFNRLHNNNFNISLQDLKSIISKDSNLILEKKSDTIEILKLISSYYKSKEYYDNEEDLYNFSYTKNLFEEEKNLNALSIYKIIMDSEEITYAQISKILKDYTENKINLDLKQVAHYCKELKKYNLILVKVKSSKNNERVVVKNKVLNMYSDVNNNKFNLFNREDSDDSYVSEADENMLEENNNSNSNFYSKRFYKFSKDPERIMEMSKEEKNFLNMKNQINMNKIYLENRFSFYVDDLCIENNILFHLLIKKEKGLTINEITFLLGLHGREKTTNRILSNMEKNNLIKHFNIRKGKKYEFSFMLREEFINKIPKHIILKYENFVNSKNLKLETESNSKNDNERLNEYKEITHENINANDMHTCTDKCSSNNLLPIEKNNLNYASCDDVLNNTASISQIENSRLQEDNMAKTLIKSDNYTLDSFFNKLAMQSKTKTTQKNPQAIVPKSEDTSKIHPPVVKKTTTSEFKLPIKDMIGKNSSNYQDLNKTDFKFIINQILTNPNLQKIKTTNKLTETTNLENLTSELKRKILLDYFNAHLNLFKIKSINDVSYNRYIYTLNKINQSKFITVNELKVYILNELEKTIGFVIDRRTIKNLFMNLEKLGLIKTLEFELTMRNKLYNYLKNTEITQKKIVSISREIEVNEEVEEKLQEILLSRHSKVTSSEFFFNEEKLTAKFEDEDDEEEVMEGMKLNHKKMENFDQPSESQFLSNNFKNTPNSQIFQYNNNFIKTEISELKSDEIIQEINHLTSNNVIKISYTHKNILNMISKIFPIEMKFRKKIIKDFIENWKKFYFVKENLTNLFSRKANKYGYYKSNMQNDTNTDTLPMHKIFSNSSMDKVILPKFLKDKLLNKNFEELSSGNTYTRKYKTIDSYFDDFQPISNNQSININSNNNNNNIADLITQRNNDLNSNNDDSLYNYQMIDYFNVDKQIKNFLRNSKLSVSLSKDEQKFANKFFKTGLDFGENSELTKFLENKRVRRNVKNDNNYLNYLSKLPMKNITKKQKRFNTTQYKKIVDMIPLVKKIYFNPKIKIRKLSYLLPTLNVSSDILLHLNKLGIINMTRDGRRIEDNFKNNFNSWEILRNDVSLELDEKANIFFDI